MGQLQNAFNAGVGSIIASKAMAEHLQGQALNAAESQYDEAKEIGKNAEELANRINNNDTAKNAAIDLVTQTAKNYTIKHPRDEKNGRFINKQEYHRKLDMDLDVAKDKLNEVIKEQDSILAQREAFNNRMDLYNKRQAILQNNLNRLPASKRPQQPNINKILTYQQSKAVEKINETNEENK